MKKTPNYRFERAERDKKKEARKIEKQRAREDRSMVRREDAKDAAAPANEPEEK